MQRLYQFLKWLWVAVIVGGLAVSLAGDCLSGLLFQGEGCTPSQAVWDSLPVYAPWVLGLFLLMFALTLVIRHEARREQAREGIALLKPAEKLLPEDLGFQILDWGEHPDPHKRPFYPTYIPRSTVDKDSNNTYDEEALIDELRTGKSIVLLGPPLSGKSRTLYEIAKQIEGYQVLSPLKGKDVPEDDEFSLLFKGRRVILLLEDLNDYVASGTPLPEYAARLERYALSWVVAATCGDGAEMAVVKAAEGTVLGRFYRDLIDLKLDLFPLTAGEKEQLARSVGNEWDPKENEWYPTPGSITMEEPMRAMRQRFEHTLRREHKDTLRCLQLLAFAGIQPFTHRRLQAVLENENLFARHGLHLRDCLDVVAEQAFVRRPASQDPVQPEPAYLQYAVTYIEGKDLKEDLPELANVLEELGDHDGLNNLGGTCLIFVGLYKQAMDCFERATNMEPMFRSAWLNKGVVLSLLGRHRAAVEASDQAIYLDPDDYAGWQNKGMALARAKRYVEAVEAFSRYIELRPSDSDAWYKMGHTLAKLERYQEAIEAYDRATKLGADESTFWYNKGVTLSALSRYEEALEAYDKAVRRRSGYFEAWYNKGTTLFRLGRYQDAIETAKEALTLKPNYARAWGLKGDALSKLALNDSGRWEEVQEAYEQATNLDPSYAEAWTNKGVSLLMLSQWQDAITVIDRAIELRPEHPQDWFHKGQALLMLGYHQEGTEWICRAWRARERFSDRGELVASTLKQLGYDPQECG